MDWFLYSSFVLYLTNQSTLYNFSQLYTSCLIHPFRVTNRTYQSTKRTYQRTNRTHLLDRNHEAYIPFNRYNKYITYRCSNYRGITLLSLHGKVYARVLENNGNNNNNDENLYQTTFIVKVISEQREFKVYKTCIVPNMALKLPFDRDTSQLLSKKPVCDPF